MEIKDNFIALKSIFYRCFFVGLFFLVLATVLYMPCKCFVATFYQAVFGLSIDFYYKLWVVFVGIIKTILVFFFLVPALAIHSMLKKYDK